MEILKKFNILYLLNLFLLASISYADGAWTKVFFKLQGRNLPDKDNGDNDYSDPFVKVHTQRNGGSWTCIGRSETKDNNHNPDWKEIFSFDYEINQNYRVWIEVRDHDGNSADNPIGNAYFYVTDRIPGGRLNLSGGGYVIITPDFFGDVGGGSCLD